MDRTIAPTIAQIERISLPEVKHARLSSGVNIYYTIDRSIDAFKIEALTQCGFLQSKNATIPVLLSKLIMEGTKKFPGNSLMESVDNLGSFLEVTPSFDYNTITLFGLSRFFNENINIFSNVVYDATLAEKELEKLKSREIERLNLNRQKGSYLSSINLRTALFSPHPYGHTLKNHDIEALTINELKNQYHSHIHSFDIFIAGNIPNNFLTILEEELTHKTSIPEENQSHSYQPASNSIIRNQKFIQSSIRLGKVLFNRDHKDYLDFLVLNEVLGGYFGSRLMKNIREDKGYTYGISSNIYALKNTGYFTISTDVNGEAEKDTLIQIEKEIEILQNNLITEEELRTVKNYLLGAFTNSLSAPFASIDKFKVLNNHGYDLQFYNHYVQSIKLINSSRLLELAQNHLKWEEFTHSIVGK